MNPNLFDGSGEGAALRETWRQCLHGTIQPLGNIVQQELQEKLDPGIILDFSPLFASDLMGRARAFQSMINGGMDVAKAAGLAGLMTAD